MILVSHDMAEVETLCSRIAIMQDGRLRCIGEGASLRRRYGGGYSLCVRFDASGGTEARRRCVAAVRGAVPGARVVEDAAAEDEDEEAAEGDVGPGAVAAAAEALIARSGRLEFVLPMPSEAVPLATFREEEAGVAGLGSERTVAVEALSMGQVFRRMTALQREGEVLEWSCVSQSLDTVFRRVATHYGAGGGGGAEGV